MTTTAQRAAGPHGAASEPLDASSLPDPPRRGLRPRTLVLVAVGFLAFALNLLVLTGGDDPPHVWVTARAIPGGTMLTEADLRAAPVLGVGEGAVVLADRPVVGSFTVVDLPAGAALRPSDLQEGLTAAGPTMAIAVPTERAVDGTLSAGDLVDIVKVDRDGVPAYVARGLRVVRGPDEAADRFGRAGEPAVLVEVVDAQALAVASALAAGDVFIVLVDDR